MEAIETLKKIQNQTRPPGPKGIDPLALQLTRDINLQSSKTNNQTAKWEHEDLAKVSGFTSTMVWASVKDGGCLHLELPISFAFWKISNL